VAQLRPHPDLPIVFVSLESVERTEAFRLRTRSPHPFIADPGRVLYQAFGLKRAGLPQVLNRATMRRGIEAARAGHSLLKVPTADPMQLAGTFVIGRDGQVLWGHRSEEVSDNVYAVDIRAHLPVENEAGV
jgi:hypothetical protein